MYSLGCIPKGAAQGIRIAVEVGHVQLSCTNHGTAWLLPSHLPTLSQGPRWLAEPGMCLGYVHFTVTVSNN